jgi:predicted Rossmann fold flavoprotein
VLEHNERLGKKIRISGGGRCNFTNYNATPDNYLSANPHFCKSALARYKPADFIALVEKHGIAYHEKKLGQLFCDFSSREIVELWEKECAAARVDIRLNTRVLSVAKPDDFVVQTSAGEFRCQSLVIATGGLSFPKIGATDFGYRVAKQFGLSLVETRPGLVPLTFSPQEQARFGALSGISLDTEVTANGRTFRENILFTHRGVSGPAILQISSYSKPGETIAVNLLPEQSALEFFESQRGSNKELKTALSQFFPQRFAQEWCEKEAPSKPLNRYRPNELAAIAQKLHRWELRPNATEGYAKAEVTLGGVDTNELSSKTMESRQVPGLFFIGEVVDVTGWLGGYNFQWAWASGNAAGQAV